MAEMTIVTSTGYEFQFRAIAPVDNDKLQPSIAIPLPNQDPDNQLLFRFTGQNETINAEFVLFPSTTDLSDGTAPAGDYPTGVKTVLEQVTYLRDVIFASNFAISWSVLLPSSYTSAVTVVIEGLNINTPPGGQNFRIGRIQLKRGKLAGL